MENRYIKEMRQRIGKEENDSSIDNEIFQMEPFERVRLIVGWNLGDGRWADTFKNWCESQGIYLTTNKGVDGIIE